MEKLPKLTAALKAISEDGKIPDHCWKTIDRELTDKLLKAGASVIRPLKSSEHNR